MMNWLIALIVLVIIGFLLDREIFFYEGVHFGPRVQAWLYDRWSKKYDEGKRESQLRDDEMLARPLMGVARHISEPFVLDFAAGTGRLSYALMNRPEFRGHIIAVDLSQGMLEQAASKLSQHPGRVEFLRHQSLPLPFPDSSFDVVCALEVLELFPSMETPLAEFSRVLRPGGIFLSSRGTEESGRRAKVKSVQEYTSLLHECGFENIQITRWWKLFDRVVAVKKGTHEHSKNRTLQEVLKCVECHQIQWQNGTGHLICLNCNHKLLSTIEGIILN